MPSVPYGYRVQGNVVVPDPREQKTLRVMKGLRGRGESYKDVAAEMNRRKLLFRGKYWKPRTVGYLLRREGFNGRPRRRR